MINLVNVNSEADCLAKCADTDGCSSASVENVKNGNKITSRRCHLGKNRNGYMLYSQKNYISANMYCQSKFLVFGTTDLKANIIIFFDLIVAQL